MHIFRLFAGTFLISCLAFSSGVEVSWEYLSAKQLESYQWDKRVLILVYRTKPDAERILERWDLLSKQDEFNERKLRIHVRPQRQLDQIIFDKIKPNLDKRAEWFLIGLDGDIKLKGTAALNTDLIFATIDLMPMRIKELENKQQQLTKKRQ